MTRDLAELDRRIAVARIVDQIERDARSAITWRARRRTDGPFRTLALILVAGLAAVLTWASRRGAR
jgi:hypothetical protein